jgi:hypothetical protein
LQSFPEPSNIFISIVVYFNRDKSMELKQVADAFPGDEGLPLPYDSWPEDYRKLCKDYWDRHVFLDRI